MDEPLSNLDAKLRVEMRAEIARIQRDLRATTIYVTHDQVEAMTLGDRVAVMRDGFLQQVGSPKRSLRPAREPLRRRVHRLAGDEPRRRGHRRARTARCALCSARTAWPSRAVRALAQFAGRRVILGVRPEDLEDAAVAGAPRRHDLRGRGHPRGPRLGGARPLRRRRARRPRRGREGGTRRGAARGDERRRPGARAASSRRASSRESTRPRGRADRARRRTSRLHFFEIETGERDLGRTGPQDRPERKIALGATFRPRRALDPEAPIP